MSEVKLSWQEQIGRRHFAYLAKHDKNVILLLLLIAKKDPQVKEARRYFVECFKINNTIYIGVSLLALLLCGCFYFPTLLTINSILVQACAYAISIMAALFLVYNVNRFITYNKFVATIKYLELSIRLKNQIRPYRL